MQPASTTHKPSAHTYISSFDTIRAAAVIMVLLLHGSFGLFKGGWIGVDLFFVLSGFLITSILYREFTDTHTISIVHFYKRRLLRLLPALILTIILANLLWKISEPYFYDSYDQKLANLAAIFYFTNCIPGHLSGNMAHLWSLAVEEHFYFFWPLLSLLLIFRLKAIYKIIFILSLIILVGFFRFYAYHHPLYLHAPLFIIDSNHFTLCRIDGILSGALLFLLLAETRLKNWTISIRASYIGIFLLAVIFTIILFTLHEDNGYYRNGGFVLTNILCVFTIWIACKNASLPLLNNNVMKWIGVRSYGIYLYHLPIFTVLNYLNVPHNKLNFVAVFGLKIGVSFLLAYVSFKFIEKPLLKLKYK